MNLLNQSILIVEDEAVLAMMLEDYLVDLGARVVGPATTVKQALELLESEVVDVAMLDVNLRGERSDLVGAALKSRGIPYIYATGYGAAGDVKRLDAATVRKPYRLDELTSALISALEQNP